MATKAQLKSYFETGDKPLSSEFDELIESCYGTDQQVYFDGTNIRLTNSDGSPDQIQNISNLNKQTLSYNDTTRELNLSGNTPAGPFGPILGLWTPVGMPTFSAGDISYPGNVSIHVLVLSRSTRLKAYKFLFYSKCNILKVSGVQHMKFFHVVLN